MSIMLGLLKMPSRRVVASAKMEDANATHSVIPDNFMTVDVFNDYELFLGLVAYRNDVAVAVLIRKQTEGTITKRHAVLCRA